jgi:hypothetical protein
MIEQDYIMRMITMLTAVIAKVLHLKFSRDFPHALLELQTASKSILGVPLPLLNSLGEEQIIELYRSDLTASVAKLHVAGTLLKEEADLLFLQGQSEESLSLSVKALRLLLESLLSAGEPLDEHHLTSIDALRERLEDRSLSADLRIRIVKYFEWKGRFGTAEDLLYDLMEEDERFVQEGMGFYERLLQKPDEILAQGNLPRPEVEEGLKKARERLRFIRIRKA